MEPRCYLDFLIILAILSDPSGPLCPLTSFLTNPGGINKAACGEREDHLKGVFGDGEVIGRASKVTITKASMTSSSENKGRAISDSAFYD